MVGHESTDSDASTTNGARKATPRHTDCSHDLKCLLYQINTNRDRRLDTIAGICINQECRTSILYRPSKGSCKQATVCVYRVENTMVL
jgi:hypothetical protein